MSIIPKQVHRLFVFITLSFISILSVQAFAGEKWTVTIKNNALYAYEIASSSARCWYLNELTTPFSIASGDVRSFQIDESYAFPQCIIGKHFINLFGFIPELSTEAVHKVYFSNSVDFTVIPHATYLKKIYWLNYSDKTSREYLSFDHSMLCDSKSSSGNMSVFMEVLKNGDLSIYSNGCSFEY